jgi:hypothetical protein
LKIKIEELKKKAVDEKQHLLKRIDKLKEKIEIMK